MSVLSLALACCVAAPLQVASPVYTDPGELPLLRAVDNTPLPLEHTDVKADISGFVVRVEVKQTYANPSKNPLEAIYIFPLPENSAVDDMRMRIGDREIRAEIKRRDEARETYEVAKQQGHTAALLEQERPNVFTQSVANIAPGARIDVTLTYVQTLTYDNGVYEMVFPMVVGPRFVPSATQVPDAARISPPYFGAGERNGHDITLEVTAHPGFPIKSYDVPTHDVVAETLSDGGLRLKLAAHDKLPNRDFVLHYDVSAKQPQVALLTHGDTDGEFALIVQPPQTDLEATVGKREIIFVVDVSGSMSGVPLAMCKDAMRYALRMVRPVDTFNVLVFASRTGQAFAQPLPANDANIALGMRYVEGLTAGGGTQMADAVAAALAPPAESDRHRYVFFLTDGYVGNEQEIINAAARLVATQKRSGARARVFGFGVGSSVNRMLLDGLGKAGEGATVYVTTREDPALAVNTFFRMIDAPIIEDLTIDWGSASVSEIYPEVLPDLFASRPTIIHGRFSGKADTTITIKGAARGKAVSVATKASFGGRQDGSPALASLWARSKVESLERDLWGGPSREVVEAITEVGLRHRLVTVYTSFVAVDMASKVSGKLQTVNQPVHAPEGVDMEMAGAEQKRQRGPTAGMMYHPAPQGGGGGLGRASGAIPMKPKAALSVDESEGAARERKKNARLVAETQDLVVGAGLDANAVRALLTANKAKLDAVLAKVGFSGRVTLRWFVTAQGTVLQCKVTSGALDAATAKELVAIIAALKFPAAAQSTASVEYVLTR